MEDFFGAVDDDFSAGFADVFDFVEEYFCGAGSYTVDAFDGCSNECGAYAV